MLLELNHRVSKSGSSQFWSLAMDAIPKLIDAKRVTQNQKKIPQFRSMRNKLHDDHLPKISLEVAYRRKDTGDILILQDLEKIPVKKFPRSKYQKLYESASVKVSILRPFTT